MIFEEAELCLEPDCWVSRPELNSLNLLQLHWSIWSIFEEVRSERSTRIQWVFAVRRPFSCDRSRTQLLLAAPENTRRRPRRRRRRRAGRYFHIKREAKNNTDGFPRRLTDRKPWAVTNLLQLAAKKCDGLLWTSNCVWSFWFCLGVFF